MAIEDQLQKVIALLRDEEEMADGEEYAAISFERFNNDLNMTEDEADKLLTLLAKRGIIAYGRETFVEYLSMILPKKMPPYTAFVRFIPGKLQEALLASAPSQMNSAQGAVYFDQGVLHRDFTKQVIIFREGSNQHDLLSVAFDLPPNTRIDCMTEGIDMDSFEQLYNAAKGIQDRIAKEWESPSRLFAWDFGKKCVERLA